VRLTTRPEISTASTGHNDPVYDENGRRMVIRECWRLPLRPFAAPRCHDRAARRIGWNVYRCSRCAKRMQPERLYHRLMLGRNPFRQDGSLRDLVKVTRWARAS
jgi:ribosomal protein L37AE/L43A